MASIGHLRPRSSRTGTERLLADVEQAVAVAELGERRPVIRELTADLRCNHAWLQTAIAELKAWGANRDPETAHRISLREAICTEWIDRIRLLLRQGEHLNALPIIRDVSPVVFPARRGSVRSGPRADRNSAHLIAVSGAAKRSSFSVSPGLSQT